MSIWNPNIGDANNVTEVLEHLHRDIAEVGWFVIVAIIFIISFSSSCKFKNTENQNGKEEKEG